MNNKVFYSNLNSGHFPNEDNLPLEREHDYVKSKRDIAPSFYRCPVWNHRVNRTYLVLSPVDFEITISDNKYNFYMNGESSDSSEKYVLFNQDDFNSNNHVVHITFPNYFFWTTAKKDLWFEYLEHPLTSLNNNFVSIGGWFNIKNYPRSSSFSFEIVDKEKGVSVKKGDPLAKIRFYSENMNDGISLIHTPKVPREIYGEFLENRSHVLVENKKEINRFLFGNVKKCPFEFLYK
jgi:hypothetical protein